MQTTLVGSETRKYLFKQQYWSGRPTECHKTRNAIVTSTNLYALTIPRFMS
jgi:hypothetical protein